MLTPQQTSDVLTETFYSYGYAAIDEFPAAARFAHYTSADVAMQIISAPADERSIWLRNATEMNDFSEVEYGQFCLRQCLMDQPFAERLRNAFNAVHPDILPTAVGLLDQELTRIKANTYLLSLAVHDGAALERGVLSMWRAYGGDANVCLLLNTGPFLNPQEAYSSYISPVFYGGPEGFRAHLLALIEKVEAKRDELRQIDPNTVSLNFKFALDAAVLSTKHPSFEEEREWRLIFRPPADPSESDVPSKVVNVGGIVQRVYYVPMRNLPDKGLHGAELNEVLYRVLIGPTPNPALVREAFVQLLRDAGVDNPDERVRTSDVPLRRW